MNQQAFWDAAADSKEFSHPLDLNRFSTLVPQESRILDYGCGYGRLCGALRRAGYSRLIGVDPSIRMIDRARAENPGVPFQALTGDWPLPFEEAAFDAVLLFSVLTCIVRDEDQRAIVAEIARVLRRDGIVCVSDTLLQPDDRNRARYEAGMLAFGRYGVFELEPGVVFRHLDSAWVANLFADFTRLELLEVDVRTMNGNPAKAFQYWGTKPQLPGHDSLSNRPDGAGVG